MQQSDTAAFNGLVADVMAFYRQDVSEFGMSVWWQACQGFDLEQVRKTLNAHAVDPERGQWAPKPADIVRALQGTHADRSLIAWGKVLDAIHRIGAYQSVEFEDKAIHCAITDMGGWPAVCRTEIDALPFVQKRFCDAHRVYSARGAPDVPRLAGEHEQTNAKIGAATQTVLAGRRDRELSVAAALTRQDRPATMGDVEIIGGRNDKKTVGQVTGIYDDSKGDASETDASLGKKPGAPVDSDARITLNVFTGHGKSTS